MPVVDIETLESNYGQSDFSMQYMGVRNLDFKINRDKIIEDYISSKQGSFAYKVEKIKLLEVGKSKS